jgi:ABC-type antimicrobial peptide transport system permease subunit
VRPAIFLSALRFPDQQRDLVLRTELPPDVVLPALRGVAGRVEPALALYQITSMPTLVGRSLASDRFITGMLAAFAIAALGLAAVGIFGVVTGDVTGRRTEIGVRMALGGRAGALVSMFVRRAMIRAAAGVAIGAAIALGASRSMASLLFGVGADDPLSFAGVALLLFAVAATAAAIPAVQAVRRSPVASLQRDA